MTKIEAPERGWLIHKSGRGWYRPDAKGYTMNQDEAGRYSHKDALAYSHPNGTDGPRDGLTIKHESELPPSPADLHQQALDAAREEGRRAGLEEAAQAVDDAGWYCIPPYEETGDLSEQIDHSLAAIRALIDKPADQVAEAARVLLYQIERARIPSHILKLFYSGEPTSALRTLAQKDEE